MIRKVPTSNVSTIDKPCCVVHARLAVFFSYDCKKHVLRACRHGCDGHQRCDRHCRDRERLQKFVQGSCGGSNCCNSVGHNGQSIFISNWACTEIVRLALRWTAETSVCRDDFAGQPLQCASSCRKIPSGSYPSALR